MLKKILSVSAVLGGLLLVAAPALAAGGETQANVSCVAAAVNVREQALGTGINAYTQAVTGAYSARASALQQAYSLTPGKGVISAAVKKAWSDFRSAMKAARNNWTSARNSAWSQFKASAKACKAPASTLDHANASSEASGN